MPGVLKFRRCVLHIVLPGGKGVLRTRQFTPKIGGVVQAGQQVAVDCCHIEFRGGASLNDRGEHTVVGVMLQRYQASVRLGKTTK